MKKASTDPEKIQTFTGQKLINIYFIMLISQKLLGNRNNNVLQVSYNFMKEHAYQLFVQICITLLHIHTDTPQSNLL